MVQIEIITGDITSLEVDGIVNAANNSLRGGGGVDGAIHNRAGAQLLQTCIELGGCATGDAKITPGFELPAKYVIHTVGPIWRGGGAREEQLLSSCYEKTLILADKHQLETLAFPAISCGVYGYPLEEACAIAYQTVHRYLQGQTALKKVYFVCFNERVRQAYKLAASRISSY